MKTLHKILKISAKESFKNLQFQGPIFCPAIEKNVKTTRVFWDYINFSKDRSLYEIAQRLSFFPLIPKVLKEGIFQETRKKFYRIAYTKKEITFILILEKIPKGVILLSCFIQYKKNALSLPSGTSGV